MTRFLIRRVLQGLLVIWLITILLFGMFFVAPSNVAQTLGGRQATPATIALINQRLGLDRPLWEQYLSFVGNALRGDLGYDYYKQIPVTSIIGEALPKTISIAVGAALITIIDYRVEIVAMAIVFLVAAVYLLTRPREDAIEVEAALAA